MHPKLLALLLLVGLTACGTTAAEDPDGSIIDGGVADSSTRDASVDGGDTMRDASADTNDLMDASTSDTPVADAFTDTALDVMESTVANLCRTFVSRWEAAGDLSDGSTQCSELSGELAPGCARHTDLCLPFWECVHDAAPVCNRGRIDTNLVWFDCGAFVDDPAIPGDVNYDCFAGVTFDPPPEITGPADQACRDASAVVSELELMCFGAGGGDGDVFCSGTIDACEGYFHCLRGTAACDEKLRSAVPNESCLEPEIAEPDGFSCRTGRRI